MRLLRRSAPIITLACVSVLAPGVSAAAQTIAKDPISKVPTVKAPVAKVPETLSDSSLLWATVNVCDTAAAPDTIGIRASMPGTHGGREVMWMRFRAQYFSSADSAWHQVVGGGDSGWVKVGSARLAARQAGRSFRLAPASGSVLLRGVVRFQWKLNGTVVQRARVVTEGGHVSSAGDDPVGYSAPTCTITA